MTDKISRSFAGKLQKSGIIKIEELEVYEYGTKILLQDAITSICILLTGLFMRCLPECITLYLTFAVLKKYSGGIHAGKYIVCFIVSNLLMAAMMLAVKYTYRFPCYILPVLLITGLVLITVFSPAESPNKPLSAKERKRYRRVAVILACVLASAGITLYFNGRFNNIGAAIIMGLFSASVMTAAGRIKQRRITKTAEKVIKMSK